MSQSLPPSKRLKTDSDQDQRRTSYRTSKMIVVNDRILYKDDSNGNQEETDEEDDFEFVYTLRSLENDPLREEVVSRQSNDANATNGDQRAVPKASYPHLDISMLKANFSPRIEHKTTPQIPLNAGQIVKEQIQIRRTRSERKCRVIEEGCYFENCPERFTLKTEYIAHLAGVHSAHYYQCLNRGCSQSFESRSALNLHITEQHSQILHCSVCPRRVFTSYASLNDHWKTYHQNGSFACNSAGCTYVSPRRHLIVKHYHTNHSHFICPNDGRRFISSYLLKLHRKSCAPRATIAPGEANVI